MCIHGWIQSWGHFAGVLLVDIFGEVDMPKRVEFDTVRHSLILVFDLVTTPQFLGVDPLWSWQAPPPAWSVQYIQVLCPHWALPLWRTALPASHPVVKLTLLYIPLGRCCLSTLSALMAELTSVGRKKKEFDTPSCFCLTPKS